MTESPLSSWSGSTKNLAQPTKEKEQQQSPSSMSAHLSQSHPDTLQSSSPGVNNTPVIGTTSHATNNGDNYVRNILVGSLNYTTLLLSNFSPRRVVERLAFQHLMGQNQMSILSRRPLPPHVDVQYIGHSSCTSYCLV